MKLKALKEKRNITVNDKSLNIRAQQSEDGKRYIEGYAATFNNESKLLYEYHNGRMIEFTETIQPGSFDEVLRSDNLNVIHTIDHDRSKMLARTTSGTLQLSVDDIGLKYRFQVPNTSLGNDLYEMVSRGDYFESSFVFTIDDEGERWEKKGDQILRTISKVSRLYDTSTVVDGAYANTPVTIARNLSDLIDSEPKTESEVKEENRDAEKEKIENEIFLLENEISIDD